MALASYHTKTQTILRVILQPIYGVIKVTYTRLHFHPYWWLLWDKPTYAQYLKLIYMFGSMQQPQEARSIQIIVAKLCLTLNKGVNTHK